jgi:carboxyl-terminal processing protease
MTSPIRFRATKYILVYLSVISIFIAFGLGVMVGKTTELRAKIATNEANPQQITKVINLNHGVQPANTDSVDFNQFWDVWQRLKEHYVKRDGVKDVDLFYGAIQGMVAALGDPYSLYFPPKAATEFTKSFSGEFEGIGAEIGIKNKQLVVVAPIPDTPASRAGLKAGDKILAINGKGTSGMDTGSAVQLIRGPAHTTTTLTILRDGLQKPVDYIIMRAKINVPAVITEWLENGTIMHVRVMQFNDDTIPQFNKAVSEFKQKKGTGLILDLRNNPGGYLEGAIDMASNWISSGPVVSERFADGSENKHEARGTHPLAGVKTTVLVNGGSASASEIVAGALKDTKTATLIGEKTFGKGSVQDYEPFSDGSALKVTVAEWFTPGGHNINETGIQPDVEVKEDFSNEPVGQDAVIAKAIEVLKK